MQKKLLESLARLWLRLLTHVGMESLLIRWGLVIIACILFWASIIVPYSDWRDAMRQEMQLQTEKQLRLQGLELSALHWKTALDEHAKLAMGLNDLLITASSSAAAQAELLKIMRQILNQYGLQLDGQSFIDAADEEYVGEKVAVGLRVRGRFESIVKLLHNVSTNEKMIVADEWAINNVGSGDYLLYLQVAGFWPGSESGG